MERAKVLELIRQHYSQREVSRLTKVSPQRISAVVHKYMGKEELEAIKKDKFLAREIKTIIKRLPDLSTSELVEAFNKAKKYG
jgi:predicted transcriptional regulator